MIMDDTQKAEPRFNHYIIWKQEQHKHQGEADDALGESFQAMQTSMRVFWDIENK